MDKQLYYSPFFHNSLPRIGMIDTPMRSSESGYIHHKIDSNTRERDTERTPDTKSEREIDEDYNHYLNNERDEILKRLSLDRSFLTKSKEEKQDDYLSASLNNNNNKIIPIEAVALSITDRGKQLLTESIKFCEQKYVQVADFYFIIRSLKYARMIFFPEFCVFLRYKISVVFQQPSMIMFCGFVRTD